MDSLNNKSKRLITSTTFRIVEIVFVFVIGLSLVKLLTPYTENNLVLKQAVIWGANVIMIFLVWLSLKLRGQKLSDFGVTFKRITLKEGLRTFLLSLLVFVLSVLGFVLGSIIMANITGIPESADMSNYEYLRNNVFMLILTLLGVYLVSSFGEEFIYRAFLISRISELVPTGKYGSILSVVISAIIFGLVHYEWGPMGIVQTGFMGLVLGFFYLKLKKKLWVLVLAHAYMDTILMVQMFLADK